MSELVRVGFLGCGLIARAHARGLQGCDGVAVVAVHDTDRDRARHFALEVTGTTASVLADTGAVIEASDVVYVCSWTAAHAEQVMEVAAAGKHVFCEKPLAADLATAEAMTRAVERAGVVNQVGLVLRNSPSFRWLHHHVRSPGVGPLMNIVFRDDQYLPIQGLYGSTWRADVAKAGAGTLLEHSIHDLDLLGWLMGPIASVVARTGTVHGLEGIDDQASVLLVAESGAQATLTSVWHDVLSRPSQRRVEVFCRDAMLTVAGDWTGPVTHESAAGIDTLDGTGLARAAATADGLGVDPDAAFIAAVRDREPAYPDFRCAIEAHRLAEAAYRSAAERGQPVDV